MENKRAYFLNKLSWFMPRTLPLRIGLLLITMICIPVLILAYLVEVEGREALFQEKRAKLQGVARLLDDALGSKYDLSDEEQSLDREQKIKLLYERTTPAAEAIVQAYPGAGIGYYHKEFDAIISYAPNSEYGYTVGTPIAQTHFGREVMRTGVPMVAFGSQVRGDIMNVMWPIRRDGKILGYIWANEFSHDIEAQLRRLDHGLFFVLVSGIAIALVVVSWFSRNFAQDVKRVNDSLKNLPFNLNTSFPRLKGEMGEIVEAATALASSLREVRSLNESILDSIDEGVITVDVAGRITMVNPSAKRLLKLTLEDIINKDSRDVFGSSNGFNRPLLETLNSGIRRNDIETEYSTADRTVPMSVSTSLVRNADGRTIGAVAFIRDLTEQKILQQQMERAQQLAALGELVAGIAHELRNPLTTIRGFVQHIQKGVNDDERRDYLSIVLKEVDSINRIIEQMLNFAKIKPKLIQWVSISDIIMDTLVLVQTRELKERISFSIKIPTSFPKIWADGELLRQVMLNLLLNSVQAIKDKGSIIIEASALNEQVKITIVDTGCGISENALNRIFDPFFTTKSSGTGLGLSIVQRIITAHRGVITINSAENVGTTVIIHLPINNNVESLSMLPGN